MILNREIAESTLDDVAIRWLLTITGVNLTVAVGLMAAIGDIARFKSPQKLVNCFGLNRRESVRPGASEGSGGAMRAMLVEAAWAAAKAPGPLRAFFIRRVHQVPAVAVARRLAVLVMRQRRCVALNTRRAAARRPFLVAGDHQLHAAHTGVGERSQEVGPERSSFGRAGGDAQPFAPAVFVHRHDDDDPAPSRTFR